MPVLGGRKEGQRKGRASESTGYGVATGRVAGRLGELCMMVAGYKNRLECYCGTGEYDFRDGMNRALAGLFSVLLPSFIPIGDLVLKMCCCTTEEQSHLCGVCSVYSWGWCTQTKPDVHSSFGHLPFSHRSKLLSSSTITKISLCRECCWAKWVSAFVTVLCSSSDLTFVWYFRRENSVEKYE